MAITNDSYGGLNFLAKLPFVDSDRIAVIGFSNGANAINLVMYGEDEKKMDGGKQFKAAISFYGRCTVSGHTDKSIPLMQIIPENDISRVENCINISDVKRIEYHVLKGAYHAFDVHRFTSKRTDPFGNIMLYDADATSKSRELVKEFLAKNLIVDPKLIEARRRLRQADLNSTWNGIRECQGIAGIKFKAVVKNGNFATNLGGKTKENFSGVVSPNGKVRVTDSYLNNEKPEKMSFTGQLPDAISASGKRKAILKLVGDFEGCQIVLTNR